MYLRLLHIQDMSQHHLWTSDPKRAQAHLKLILQKKDQKFPAMEKAEAGQKVKHSGKTRYVSSQYLSTKKPGSSASSSSTSSSSSKGQQIANYAQQFVGNPYRYGGTSLTNGADCSGFTQSVYKKFGYSIPRTSSSQRKRWKISKLVSEKSGRFDLLFRTCGNLHWKQ